MKVRRMGEKRMVRLSRTRALWVCLLAGLMVVAAAVRPGARASLAQTTQPQPEAPPAAASAPSAANTQAATPDEPAKPEAAAAPVDPKRKQIADDTANLVKLANSLKVEVDKINPDTMSVPVIRQAEEIEKLAHKMRSK